MSGGGTWEAAEIDRILYAHRLDPALAASGPGLATHDPERLPLLLNVLVRVELRCAHDTAAIREALERPADLLGGDSIAERLRAGPDLAGLRQLREAAGTVPVPRVKMWRVADTYS